MEKTETNVVGVKVRPGFFWLSWSAMMTIGVPGMAMGFWQDGRPDGASAIGTLIFLMIGGIYRRRQLASRAGK